MVTPTLLDPLRQAIQRYQQGPIFVETVVDFDPSDIANSMVRQALRWAFRGVVDVQASSVQKFQTRACGFNVAKLACAPSEWLPQGTLVYHNVAEIDGQVDGVGQRRDQFCVALLKNGVLVAGPNNGWAYSYLRPMIEVFYVLQLKDATGETFRSKTCFPPAIARLWRNNFSDVTHAWKHHEVLVLPTAEPWHLATHDGDFGNCKLWVCSGDELLEQRLAAHLNATSNPRKDEILQCARTGAPMDYVTSAKIRIGEHELDGVFALDQNRVTGLGLAPGSDRFVFGNTTRRAFEVQFRGKSAYRAFRRPAFGAKVAIQFAA